MNWWVHGFWLLFVLSDCFALETPTDAPDIDLAGVEAILSIRCLKCHDETTRKGGLRLDTREEALKGGDSGSPVLDQDLAVSELYQRLVTKDRGARMPKGSPSLTKGEIEIIANWLQAGAPWPEGGRVGPQNTTGALPDWMVNVGNFVQSHVRIVYPWLAGAILILVGERLRGTGRRRFAKIHHSYPVLLFAILGVGLLWQLLHEKEKLSQAHQQIKILKGGGSRADSEEEELPQVHRPVHPKRLSGRWYRGNDERGSDELFNDGFYCTTIFEIALLDDSGNQLAPGVARSGEITLAVDLMRAPFATPRLFNDQRMEKAGLSILPPKTELVDEDQIHRFDLKKSGEHWLSQISIGPAPENGNQSALYYLYSDVQGGLRRPHYAIGYDLHWQEGKLQEGSEVWMGVIYLTSNVFIPPEGKIMLNEWFDARPLPMIEGGNTEDPHALGLPEHLGDATP